MTVVRLWDRRERRKEALCLYICRKDFWTAGPPSVNKSHPQKLVWNSRGHHCTTFQRNVSSCWERFSVITEQWWPDWNRVPHAANTATKVCSELAFNSFSAFVLTQLVLSLHIYGSGNSVQKSRPFDSTVETVRTVRQRFGPGRWAAWLVLTCQSQCFSLRIEIIILPKFLLSPQKLLAHSQNQTKKHCRHLLALNTQFNNYLS